MNQIDTKGCIGLIKIDDLYKQVGIGADTECLYLETKDGINIPLLPDEHIVLRGNETIIAGETNPDIKDNPPLRNPVEIEFNGKKQPFDKAKMKSDDLCQLERMLLFADLHQAVDTRIMKGTKLVLQDGDCFFTVPIGDEGEDVIDVEACGKHGHRPPRGQNRYRVRIDGQYLAVPREKITGEQLLQLVGKTYTEWSLNQKLHGGRRKQIKKDEMVDLSEPGIERFETVQMQAQQGILGISPPSVA